MTLVKILAKNVFLFFNNIKFDFYKFEEQKFMGNFDI